MGYSSITRTIKRIDRNSVGAGSLKVKLRKIRLGKLKECSCRNKDACPLDNNCLTKSLTYQASLICDNNGNFKYIGLVEGDFKKRYNNHKMSFRNERYANSTEFFKKFWDLKNEGLDPKVSWKILKIVKMNYLS